MQVAIAVVRRGDWFLVGRRERGQSLAGLAEFPGGKLLDGEAAESAAVRECLEETGLAVEIVDEYPCRVESYSHGTIDLRFFACRPAAVDAAAPLDSRAAPPPVRAPWRWVERHELSELEFPSGNREVLALIAREESADG